MNKIKAYIIRTLGLKGSWAWACRQMLNGRCVTFDRLDGTPIDRIVEMDVTQNYPLEESIRAGTAWFKEQTTWHTCPSIVDIHVEFGGVEIKGVSRIEVSFGSVNEEESSEWEDDPMCVRGRGDEQE